MHQRVLLPLDGSTLAEQALPYAVAQAERFRAELILLRAVGSLNGYGHSIGELLTFIVLPILGARNWIFGNVSQTFV